MLSSVLQFERFFPSDGCCVASVYAPIGYPPQPVLVFHHQQLQGQSSNTSVVAMVTGVTPPTDGGERAVLVATGTLHRVQPQRVVCKRVVLSGHPYKINKRSAVIRYMFFNRGVLLCLVHAREMFPRTAPVVPMFDDTCFCCTEDIVWFKPVELRTKCGRRGHIKDPLGTYLGVIG